MNRIKYLIIILLFLWLMPLSTEAAILAKPPSNLGLVGYWSFNEGTSTSAGDFSTNKNNATLYGTGSTRWVAGKFGNAVTANITNVDYASASSTDALNMGTGDFTVSAWVKTTGYSAHGSSWNMIAAKGNIESSSWTLAIQSSNKVYFTINAAGTDAFSTTTIGDNKWHHVVGVREGANMSIYVDGVFEDNGTNNGATVTNTSDITFGVDGKSDFSRTINGSIDDVRLYNRALTGAEVATLYGSGSVVRKVANKRGLIANYSFDDGAGTKLGDYSGNKRDITLSNTDSNSGGWISGKKGKAFMFDGGDDQATVSSAVYSNISPSQGTIMGWGYATTTCSNCFIVWAVGAGNSRYYIQWTTAWSVFRGDLSGITLLSAANTQLNRWYHIALTWEGGNMYGYLDGKLVSSKAWVGDANTPTSMVIGRQGGNPGFTGALDDIKMYDRALTAAEIATEYSQGSAVVNAPQNDKLTEGLVGLWSFNGKDVDSTYVYDRSGNANHGYFYSVISTSSALAIGKIGQGILLDSVNDQVWIPAMTNPASTAITVSTWIKLKNHVNWYDFSYNNWQGADGTWALYSNSSGVASFGVYKSPSQYNATGCTALSLNEWHNLVGTYDGTTVRAYVDGVACPTTPTVSTSLHTSSVIKFGEPGGVGALPMNMDDSRIYNRALSASEVKRLYLMGK